MTSPDPRPLLLDHLRSRLQLIPAAPRYWVAYSGGRDSHTLLHAMCTLAHTDPEGRLGDLAAVHINHALQPAADAWQSHVERICGELGVTCRVLRVDVEPDGEGLEAAARRARYRAISLMLGAGEVLLTAHHLDDQAETLLLRLLRGSGVQGLAAMSSLRAFSAGWLARPLLHTGTELIAGYARREQLQWIEDQSNADRGRARSYLRHEVLPALERYWPAARQTIARAAAVQADGAEILAQVAAEDLGRLVAPGRALSIDGLAGLSRARARNVLWAWLRERSLPPAGTQHLEAILDTVATARADACPQVTWPGVVVRRYRGALHAHSAPEPVRMPVRIPWRPPRELELPHGRLITVAQRGSGLAVERIAGAEMTVGLRVGGERCRPVGRGISKSLKHLFQELGVPPWERGTLPLVFADGVVVAVPGMLVCEPFAAGPGEDGWRIEWQRRSG